ncbi:hypothetical protein AVEN_151227-1 [Araneus ventricosus]|uniref:Histone-lysine N-methyltransferase SETMAR n=1 Tax=Araneus ventricosus TaxID=182803 RepID=A0A4Y2FX38_ARAVE|nr:hypothetical protein AVEN_226338-1 [Araneus ventricosus]GBM45949.1 hypothetical protein AVEN_151227-1 [Araneus ventricosus]
MPTFRSPAHLGRITRSDAEKRLPQVLIRSQKVSLVAGRSFCFVVACSAVVSCETKQMKIDDQPDLAPGDFHLFGSLKQHPGGKHFADEDDVQHEVLLRMRQQPKEFYAAGIGALIKRWDKCINIGGDYVEK